jgi:hypothetical protein
MSRDAHKRPTFLEKYVNGKVSAEEIDDYIDSWHTGTAEQSIYEFLGLSQEEYSLWLQDPEALPYIAAARQTKKPLSEVIASRLKELSTNCGSRDARKAQRLHHWLEQHG